MLRAVDQRPEGTGRFGFRRIATKQTGADSEQDAPAQFQAVRNGLAPRKRVQQRQPGVFKAGQRLLAHAARQKLRIDRLQSRLRRRHRALVQLLQPLAPPRQPDRAEARIARRRNDIRKGKIELPQCGEGRPDREWQLLERDLPVVVEPALSDK
jgi:hypothetical protein